MKTDDEIIEFSKSVPGYYDEDELRNLLKLTRSMPANSLVVEIGVEFGRSASIFMQCPENVYSLFLIDDRSINGELGRVSTNNLVRTLASAWVTQFEIKSDVAAALLFAETPMDLIHIDADHGPGIWQDCLLWLPKVRIGGIVVFHDFERKGADPTTGSVFPEVDKAVRNYIHNSTNFSEISHVNTQLVAMRNY